MVSLFTSITSPSWLWIWFLIEFISIVVIAIGCAGEAWAEIHKFSDKVKNSPNSERLGKKRTSEQRKNWWKFFFGWVVVGGLAIELIAFSCSFIASNREIEGLKGGNLRLSIELEKL